MYALDLMNDKARLEDLAKFAKDVALLHGFIFRPKEPQNSELAEHITFTLFPTPVPRAAYLQAKAVQVHFNTLMARVSQDADFLEEALASTVKVDDFIARLFRIHKTVVKEGRSPFIALGLNRSDYMLDQSQPGTSVLKQTEINTMAAGVGGLIHVLAKVHRIILMKAGRYEEERCILENNAVAGQTKAMAKAWELYGSQSAVALMLITGNDTNIFEQRSVQVELLKFNITMILRRFKDVLENGFLTEDGRLFVDGKEVAVVYYMHGFVPQQYTSEEDWEALLMIERSLAVKCPDIATHLAGTKKVQQVLSQPGVLERFFPEEPHVVEQIRATFTRLYSLDMGPEGDRAVEMAIADPEHFIMKPQREGGGNNIYSQDISKVLKELKGPERSAYILMEKILPIPSPNILLRRDKPPTICDCLSELSMYGAYVRHGKEMVLNEPIGHLLRTKVATDHEGGLMIGRSGIDNPLLY